MNEKKDQLLKEIAVEEKILAKLPSYKESDDRAVWQERAKHQTNLNEKKGQLQLIEEEERIKSVVQEHLELHPYMLEKDCPICLETIPVTEHDTFHLQSCCGGVICMSCIKEIMSTNTAEARRAIRICPLCRGGFPANIKDRVHDIRNLAAKGNVCAQHMLAGLLYSGRTIPKNKKQALKLLRACQDSHPGSASLLLMFHKYGDCGLEKSEEKQMILLQQSAEGGYRQAQEEYASMMWWQGRDDGKERVDAGRYASLVYNLYKYKDSGWNGNKMQSFGWVLGSLFQYGEGGMNQSWYLAKHYLQIAANNGDPFAYFQLAQVLISESQSIYDGNLSIPGFSPVPKALYWARKAFDEKNVKVFISDQQATAPLRQFTQQLESEVKRCCANCYKGTKETKIIKLVVPLSCCVRCRAAWYCCKECQVEHWNAGHKVDCIKPQKKKVQS